MDLVGRHNPCRMSELSPKSLQTEFRDCFGCLPYYEIVYLHPET
jgi:hypothetical protein